MPLLSTPFLLFASQNETVGGDLQPVGLLLDGGKLLHDRRLRLVYEARHQDYQAAQVRKIRSERVAATLLVWINLPTPFRI